MFRFAALVAAAGADCALQPHPAEPTESAEDDDLYWRLHAMSNGRKHGCVLTLMRSRITMGMDIKAALLEISAHGMSDAEIGAAIGVLNRSLRACATACLNNVLGAQAGHRRARRAIAKRAAGDRKGRVVTDAKVRHVINCPAGRIPTRP